MPTLTSHTAAEIRAEMARQRITQVQVAAALGMSQPVVSRMLRGDRPLTLDFIQDVAAVLDVPIGQLLNHLDDDLRITPVIRESSMLLSA
jgi:transcriptional regulator with XRE-family HTH domain